MAHFNFENLVSKISDYGVARPNRFEAEILFPAAVQSAFAGSSEAVSVKVKSLTMPGRNISTTTNDTIYGPTHEIAAGLTYADEINISFILSGDLNEKRRFDAWQNYIYSPTSFNMNYYDDYISTINIYQLNENGDRVYGCQLREVFPKSVNPIEYNNDTTSAILELQVGFAFREWVEMPISGQVGQAPAIPETTPTIYYPAKPVDRSILAEQNDKKRLEDARQEVEQIKANSRKFGYGWWWT